MSSHRTRQSKRRSRGHIDGKIMQLRLQNSKLPVYKFPVEILSLIFVYVRDEAIHRLHSHSMLVVSWVSFHWREVITSNPFLWNFLDVKGDELVNIFLSRSREVKLSVDLWAESPNDFVPVFKESRRLESLRLMCPEIDDFEEEDDVVMHDDAQLRPYWSQPAPYLQELSLENFPIPPNPFDNSVPALRHVQLIWCNFEWDSFPFADLISLQIVCPGDIINPAQFVQKLHQMPSLERLMLDAVLVGSDGPGPVRLNLPHLKQLSVATVDPTTLIDFLQRVSIPPTSELVVQPDNCGDLVPEIIFELRTCQDGASKHLRKFTLEAYDTNFSIEATTQPTPSNEEGTLLHGGFGQWTFDGSITHDLFQYYDFSGLTTLQLHSDTQQHSPDIWETIFTPLPHLVGLDLLGIFASSFIEHFTNSASRITDLFGTPETKLQDIAHGKLRDRLIFPSLERLALARVGLFVEESCSSSSSEKGNKLDEDVAWPGDFMMFRFVMGMRWLVGCGLPYLKIRRWTLTDAQRDDLKRMVGILDFSKFTLAPDIEKWGNQWTD